MLQTIRDRAQGWIAWVIVILISIPFILWGIESYIGGGGEPIAATVNGVELPARDLDRRVQQARFELRERLGAAYDPAEFDDKRIRSEVLDTMIRESLLMDVVRRLGLRVSDEEVQMQILADPSFVKDGRFDHENYARLLKYQGMSPAMYEAQLRQKMTASQLIRAVSASELATRAEVAEYQRLMDQKRELTYVRFPVADYQKDAPIDEARITAFYDANAARFRTPEQVKLDYLMLDAETLSAKVEVSEDDLRQRYDSDQARFVEPERRAVRHLLRKVPADADEKAANAVLDEVKGIRQRMLAGESFEALAKTLSQDPGSAAKGGSLGTIESGVMVPAFDQAAFALPKDEISEPVRTPYGYHLIQVTEIVPAKAKPFETVRDALRAEIAKQRAEGLYYDQGERLASVTYESPDSLEPAAQQFGLAIQHSDWISREASGEGILAQPKVIAAAFSDDVLSQGRNSDMVEPEQDRLQAVVLRVADHRDAAVKPLAEVRDEIIAEIRKDAAKAGAKAAADALAEKLRQGADWAGTTASLKPESPGLVDRKASDIPAAVLDTAFKLGLPKDGAASIGTAVIDNGDAVLVRVTRVQDGEVRAAKAGEAAPEAFVLTQVMGRQAYTEMLKDMQDRAKIKRNKVDAGEAP